MPAFQGSYHESDRLLGEIMPSPLNRQLAAGKPAAFAELYDAVADSVYHYLLVQTGSPADAADLLQEALLRIYRILTLGHTEIISKCALPAEVFRIGTVAFALHTAP